MTRGIQVGGHESFSSGSQPTKLLGASGPGAAMWASLATWGWGTWRLSGHFYGYVVDMLWIVDGYSMGLSGQSRTTQNWWLDLGQTYQWIIEDLWLEAANSGGYVWPKGHKGSVATPHLKSSSIPSGKLSHNYGKSTPFVMGKLTISMGHLYIP